MATVSSDLDKCQERLHDGGVLWPRVELLRWYNDSYRQFLAQSAAFSRILPLDLPGRFTYAITFLWEDRHTTGTYWFPMLTTFGSARQCTFAWEVEMLEGVAPTASRQCITQQWERAHSGEVEAHFQFGFPKEHERVRRLAWNDRRLVPTSVREFDEVDDAWMRRVGEPTWWMPGVGRSRLVEVYDIQTTYNQAYALEEYDKGLPRGFTGRTYSAEVGQFYVNNDFGYTTSGDAIVLSNPDIIFDPSSAYSTEADKDNAFTTGASQGAYRFTLDGNISQNTPGYLYYSTQPWEINNSNAGTFRAMFPWESEFGGVVAQQQDRRPSFPGLGYRFTKAANDPTKGFGTQIWEKQMQDGTTLSAGGTIATFTWEEYHGARRVVFGVGTIRAATSADRQYLPLVTDTGSFELLGSARDWRSTVDALSALEVVIPADQLVESDVPELIPYPFQKYLRYYVLSRAFGREGEGQRLDMAAHYEMRFQRGVTIFKRLADVAHKDRLFVREDVTHVAARPPRVRLPAEFERVL